MGHEVKRGHQDLLETTAEIDEIMNLQAINGAWDVGGSGERWHEKDNDIIMRIKMTSMNWILDTPTNAFPRLKKQMLAVNTSDGSEYHIPVLNSPPQLGPRQQQNATIDMSYHQKQTRSNTSKHLKNPKFDTTSNYIHRIPAGTNLSDPEFQRSMGRQLLEVGQLPDDEGVDPEHEATFQRLNIKQMQPSTELRFLWMTNPIYCGIVS